MWALSLSGTLTRPHLVQGPGSSETKGVGDQNFPSPCHLWVRMRSQELP